MDHGGENQITNAVGVSIKLLPSVARAVKLSNELPAPDTPAFIYYNDFPQYQAIVSGQSRKVLSIIQHILDTLDARANVLDVPNTKSAREKFTSIVDANDKILEKMSIAMDAVENPEHNSVCQANTDLVVAVQRKHTTSLEWLKPRTTSVTSLPSSDSAGTLLKLLASRKVVRPQTFFSAPPDNSHSIFRPIIKEKPNAISPLAKSLPLAPDENNEFPHPYQAELEAFAQKPTQQPYLEELTPQPMNCPYVYVDNIDALHEAMKDLSNYSEIAVDLEHHHYRSFLGITCLVQLSTRFTDYVIDALALRDHLSCLNQIFTNPEVVKVFHGADSDLMWLQRDFGVYVINLFDTGLAARVLQFDRFSLSYLLFRYVGIKAQKQYQLADWRIRPLPEELIEYARTDTHYLLHIASLMCRELQDRDLFPVVIERGRQLCLRRYTKPVFSRLGYLDLYKETGGISLSHRQLYALENLYELRDSIARREDESLHYVLPKHMLKVIAEILPRETSGIFACCNPVPPLVRKYVHDMHKIILDARNLPLSDLPLTGGQSASSSQNVKQLNFELNVTSANHQLLTAPPHDFSHSTSLRTERPCGTGQSESIVITKASPLGHALLNRSTEHLNLRSQSILQFEPNHMLLTKILELLKLPFSALINANEQNKIDESPLKLGQSESESNLNNSNFVSLASNQSLQLNGTFKSPVTQSHCTIATVTMDVTGCEEQSVADKSLIDSTFDANEVILLCNEVKSSKSGGSYKKRRRLKRKDKASKQVNESELLSGSTELSTSTGVNSSMLDLSVIQSTPKSVKSKVKLRTTIKRKLIRRPKHQK